MHNSAHNYADQTASDGAFRDATSFATDKAAEAHFRAGRFFDHCYRWDQSSITPGETYRTARDAVCELIYRNRYQDAFEIAYQNSFMLRYQESYKSAYEKGHTSTCRTSLETPSDELFTITNEAVSALNLNAPYCDFNTIHSNEWAAQLQRQDALRSNSPFADHNFILDVINAQGYESRFYDTQTGTMMTNLLDTLDTIQLNMMDPTFQNMLTILETLPF